MNRVCVVMNPNAGRRRARKRLLRVRSLLEGSAEFWTTDQPGAGVELAHRAADRGCSLVIAAGGDGTVHEVANGVLRSENSDVTIGVVPIGSSNDFAWSLERQFGSGSSLSDCNSLAAICERPAGDLLDVGYVTSSSGISRYFIESIGSGLSGRVTIESRRIAWLQGVALYGLAAIRALQAHTAELMELTIDDQPSFLRKTLLLSLLIGKREGGFLLAPDALMNDGQFDFVHAGPIGRWEAIKLLPRLASSGPPTNHPQIQLGRCRRLDLASPTAIVAHCDGEILCTMENEVRDLRVEIFPERLRVAHFTLEPG